MTNDERITNEQLNDVSGGQVAPRQSTSTTFTGGQNPQQPGASLEADDATIAAGAQRQDLSTGGTEPGPFDGKAQLPGDPGMPNQGQTPGGSGADSIGQGNASG